MTKELEKLLDEFKSDLARDAVSKILKIIEQSHDGHKMSNVQAQSILTGIVFYIDSTSIFGKTAKTEEEFILAVTELNTFVETIYEIKTNLVTEEIAFNTEPKMVH